MSAHGPFTEMLARRAELSRGEERRLEEHLQSCPDCRETASVYARQASMLRSLPLVDPPPTLRARVLHEARQAPPRRRWSLWPAPLLLAPVAAAVVLASALYLRHGAGSHPTVVSQPKPAATSVPTAAATRLGTASIRHRPKKRHPALPRSVTASPSVALPTSAPAANPPGYLANAQPPTAAPAPATAAPSATPSAPRIAASSPHATSVATVRSTHPTAGGQAPQKPSAPAAPQPPVVAPLPAPTAGHPIGAAPVNTTTPVATPAPAAATAPTAPSILAPVAPAPAPSPAPVVTPTP